MRLLYLVLCSVLILTGCAEQASSVDKTEIVYGLTLEPSGFDPHIHASSELGIVLRQVYDTLVYRDPDTQEIVPGLASEWTVAEDGLSYTFILRQDVSFHDGSPFNAEAVAANLDRITNPDTLSQRAVFMLGTYTSYTILDAYTIQLNLSAPYAPLLDSLSQVYLGMASPTALASYSNNRYQFHQVGTGPYHFVEMVPGDRVVLERSVDYTWGPSFYQTPGNIDRITYRFFTDPATRAEALEDGQAQIMGELVPSTARALTGNAGVRLLPTAVPGIPLQFMMHVERAPTDNVIFRQALILATNRRVIVDTVYQGFSPVAWGPLSSPTLYYDRSLVGQYDFDPDQARSLLENLGYSDEDGNGYLDAGEGDLEVVVVYPPWGLIPQTVQLMQDQWRDVGIQAVLRPAPGFPALREAAQAGEYNLIAFDNAGYDPSVLNQFYLSDGSNNFMNYNNPELDNALTLGVQQMAPGNRRSIYAQIQQFIMDQALILPVREYVNLNATTDEVRGLRFDTYGWFPLMHAVTVE